MADAISIQELIDARTDAKTLEEAVNGDAVTTVLSRLGETYPTLSNALNQIDSKLDSADTQIKQGITNLFENGGLPAVPFATKALMTASALVDGKYAQVTEDTVNNGLYLKTAGAWVKSNYDPLTQAKADATTKADAALVQSKVYTDSLPNFRVVSTTTIDPAKNIYSSSSSNTDGFHVSDAGAIAANASSKVYVIPVKPFEQYVINNKDLVMLIAFMSTATITNGKPVTLATTQKVVVGGNTIVTIPTGFSHMVMNTKVTTTYDITASLIVNRSLKELIKYDDAVIADTTARDTLLQKLAKTDLVIDGLFEPNLLGQNVKTGIFINPVSALIQSIASPAEVQAFPIIAGETYAVRVSAHKDLSQIYVKDSLSLVANTQLTNVTYTATADSKVKTFVAPAGMTWGYLMTQISTQSYDERTTAHVNKGLTTTYGQTKKLKGINDAVVFDAAAHARIDTINAPSKVSVLKGKKWALIGDSITHKNFQSAKGYYEYISEEVGGMTTYNYALSGTGFFDQFNIAAAITETDIDYISIAYGTNDWGVQESKQKPLGVFLDTGTDTTSGCINTCLTALLAKFPTKKIVVFTPLPRSGNWGFNGSLNTKGFVLRDVVELLKKYCEHYSIPCLDLYHASNLPVWLPTGNDYYFKNTTGSPADGLHPNAAGHRVMADKIRPFLESV